MQYQPKLFQASPVVVTVLLLLSLVVVMVIVGLLLRNLLMTMWCFNDCNVFAVVAVLLM